MEKSAAENQRQLTDWFPNLSVTPLPLDRQLSLRQRGAQWFTSLSDRQPVTAHLATDHISFSVTYQRCGPKINNLSEQYVGKVARNVYDRQSLAFNAVCFSRKCNYFGCGNISVFSPSVDSPCPYESNHWVVYLFWAHLTQYKSKTVWEFRMWGTQRDSERCSS